MLGTVIALPFAALVGNQFAGQQVVDAAAVTRGMRSRVPTCVATADSFTISNPGSFTKDERMRSRYGGFVFEPDEDAELEANLFSYDELANSMREIASFTRGDVTTGEVIGFEPNGALVDIGVKSSAYCTTQEMALVKPTKPEEALELGASYEFTIVSREDENGQLMLSRRRILFAQAWDKVSQLYADDATVEVRAHLARLCTRIIVSLARARSARPPPSTRVFAHVVSLLSRARRCRRARWRRSTAVAR